MHRSLIVACLIALLAVPALAGIAKQAMRLEDVQTLVFTRNEMTASRRSSAVPQLHCVSGACQYAPTTAMCRNIGFDGRDVAWKCEAELPKGVKFGKVQVSCEGYESRDDEYVLKGSCGLEYSLEGKPRFGVEDKEELSFVERHTKSAARGYAKSVWWNPTTWSLAALPFFSTGVNAVNHAKEYARHGYEHAQHAAHDTYRHAKHEIHHQTDTMPSMSDMIGTIIGLVTKAVALMVFVYILYRIMCPTRSANTPPPSVGPTPRRGLARSLIGILPFGNTAMSVFDSLMRPSADHSDYHPSPPSYQAAVNSNSFDKTRTSSQSQTHQQAQPEQQQSSWGFLHGALAGAAGGYFMGGRRARAAHEAQTREEIRHSQFTVPPPFNPAAATYSVRNDARYPTAASSAPYTVRDDVVPEMKTTETTSAFGTTKRR